MSGEAGAAYRSRYYAFELGSGINESIDGDPEDYFEDEERKYLELLDPRVPKITDAIEHTIESAKIAAVPLSICEVIHPAWGVLEEADAHARRSFEEFDRFRFAFSHSPSGLERFEVTLELTAFIERVQVDALREAVSEVAFEDATASGDDSLVRIPPFEERWLDYALTLTGPSWIEARYRQDILEELDVEAGNAADAVEAAIDSIREDLDFLPLDSQEGEPVRIGFHHPIGRLDLEARLTTEDPGEARDQLSKHLFRAIHG